MKHTRKLRPWLLSLILPVLGACGGGSTANNKPFIPPDPVPVTTVSYDLRKAVLELYGKAHSWKLQGSSCCAGGTISASLTLQPRPMDGGTFNVGGENVSGTDITLQLQFDGMATSSSTSILWYSSKGQQMLLTSSDGSRMEATTSQGSLPTSAVPGDSGSNGETGTVETTAGNSRIVSSTSYRWELKKDSNARVLMCLNSVETPDPAYAGNNPALAAKITRSNCYGLNADSTLSGYVTLSQHGFASMGWDLATQ